LRKGKGDKLILRKRGSFLNQKGAKIKWELQIINFLNPNVENWTVLLPLRKMEEKDGHYYLDKEIRVEGVRSTLLTFKTEQNRGQPLT
jgi:hypothetical protein